MEENLRLVDKLATTAIDFGAQYGPRLLVALLILAAGFLAARWVGRGTLRALARFQLEPPVLSLIERVARILVIGLFAIMALQNLGVQLLPLVAGLGVAGAGVALAMQGVLSNMVAGLTIIFTKPYRVGDYISIQSVDGQVLEISLFSTVLGHADLSRVVVPNRKIVGEILHNYGRIRQLGIEASVSYGADIDAALRAVEEVLQANRRVLRDPAPVIGVGRLADGRVAIYVKPWVGLADFGPAGLEVNQAILAAFRSRGIALPVPQREVRMLAA